MSKNGLLINQMLQCDKWFRSWENEGKCKVSTICLRIKCKTNDWEYGNSL